MEKTLLLFFYLLVGIISVISIFVLIAFGYPLLSAWLLFSAIVNFLLFYIVWEYSSETGGGKKQRKYKHLQVVK